MNELKNKPGSRYIFLLIIFTSISVLTSFFWYEEPKSNEDGKKSSLRFMFYNVENLFDTEDDPHKVDNEFLPDGAKKWTTYRYKEKLNNIYKVIMAVGEPGPPAIIGLCEVENGKVLEDLTQNTPLVKINYSVVHHESPDQRGIDVALLYQQKSFRVIHEEAVRIIFEDSPRKKTRDILYVKGIAFKKDTLHIFVNHWPSRRGGQKQSDKSRMIVALKLKWKVDSVLQANPLAKIIITGDFNDEPVDVSLRKGLIAVPFEETDTIVTLVNLSPMPYNNTSGTLKYRGRWNVFDQFIVSSSLLEDKKGINTTKEDYHVFSASFLLKPDEKFAGDQPFPTYRGANYLAGFSDHLPVYLDLYKGSFHSP
ncbi:MAG: endonuclease [Bacteroidales bacterium]|nr:endonuclease [Bacteroidales bacterium]